MRDGEILTHYTNFADSVISDYQLCKLLFARQVSNTLANTER